MWAEPVVISLTMKYSIESEMCAHKESLATLKQKGSLSGNEEMDLGGDSPFFELEYWNFQHMLGSRFREASQN